MTPSSFRVVLAFGVERCAVFLRFESIPEDVGLEAEILLTRASTEGIDVGPLCRFRPVVAVQGTLAQGAGALEDLSLQKATLCGHTRPDPEANL